MSGGSYSYFFDKVIDTASEIAGRHKGQALHQAFADHLHRVADVLKEIEWADSCDTSQEDAQKAIREFFKPHPIEFNASLDRVAGAMEDFIACVVMAKGMVAKNKAHPQSEIPNPQSNMTGAEAPGAPGGDADVGECGDVRNAR